MSIQIAGPNMADTQITGPKRKQVLKMILGEVWDSFYRLQHASRGGGFRWKNDDGEQIRNIRSQMGYQRAQRCLQLLDLRRIRVEEMLMAEGLSLKDLRRIREDIAEAQMENPLLATLAL